MVNEGLASLFSQGTAASKSVATVLHAARVHLGMDVAFVAEFQNDNTRIFRCVDSSTKLSPIQPGQVIPLDEGYCDKVVRGFLPELIPDTAAVPAALLMAETLALPIGAHVSVPIRLSNGHVFGTFCCFSFKPDATLGPRDLAIMRVLADLVAHQIEDEVTTRQRQQEIRKRIKTVLASGHPLMVYQPIWSLQEPMQICGAECLARFPHEPVRGPAEWFSEASDIGIGAELEVAAIRNAYAKLDDTCENFYFSVNCSPETALSPEFAKAIAGLRQECLVVEITEHSQVTNYHDLIQSLNELRRQGVRIAIDDACAGYSSLKHILSLNPDIIKLDMSLIRDIDSDPARRALVSTLVAFSREIGCSLIAEGVETQREFNVLRELQVDKAQGYFLGKPLPLQEFRKLLHRNAAFG